MVEKLVTADWVQEHGRDANVRLVEVDVDTEAYREGHIEGAVAWNWTTQLQDAVTRDIISKADFEALMSRSGITPETHVVLYGDNNNWFAAYAFWLFKLYGHKDVRLMNGGRAKWLAEDDKGLTIEKAAVKPAAYKASEPDLSLRAHVPELLEAARSRAANLIDVRSTDEFTGKVIAPPGMTETAQRAGHVPGARSVPWATAVQKDGTFKSIEELREIYLKGAAVDPSKPTIAYCRIGERSSHTWFVLKYLLGLKDVKNYDGSWTEYGSMVGVPIER